MGGKSKKQTVGYKYYLGMQLEVCAGPIDAITRLRVDDRDAWIGFATGGSINVDANTLFGGDGREGGVSGTIDVCMGRPDQTRNSYLMSKLGALIPAYRGVVGLVFRQCYLGNNPYLKTWSARGQRIQVRQDGLDQWYPSRAAILVSAEIDPTATFGFNQAATAFGSAPATTYSPGRGGVIRISKPRAATTGGLLTYDAWSAWNNDAGVGGGGSPVPGQTWDNRFEVWASNGGAFTRIFSANEVGLSTNLYATADEAYDAVNALLPLTFTGWDTYRVQAAFDPNPGDNRGGISLLVQLGTGTIDMNAAHIIRECLTDPDWGMGYTDNDIDEPSFIAAANTFQSEGLGLSLLWDKTMKIEDFVNTVLQHVDTALYVSRTSGKFVLKPIRGGYDEDSLISLDESNIISVDDPTRITFGELTNSVTVTYWDATTGKDGSVTVSDTALVQEQGVVINSPVQYPGFSNARNATIAAQRDLRALSAALLSCSITADSTAKPLTIGDVFKFSWKKWGIVDLVMRVNGIAYGTGRNNRVKISCTQDVFDTDTSVSIVVPPPTWEDPSSPPSAVPEEIAEEAPYYELVQTLGQSDTDNKLLTHPEIGYVIAAAARPTSAINGNVWTDNGDGYENVGALDFAPIGYLTADIGPTDETFTLGDFADLSEVTLGTHVQIGEELMRVDAVDPETGVIEVGRGVLDTVPQPHFVDDFALFWDNYVGFDPTEYVEGESIDVKVVSASGAGVYPIEDVTPMTVELAGRAARPYAPGDLRLNDESYAPNPVYVGEVTVTWTHRNRLEQTGGHLVDYSEADIGPEPGVVYRLQGYIDDVLVHTEDDIAGNTAAWTPGAVSDNIKIEVHAKRDGIYSWQGAYHIFANTEASSFYTEEGNERYTEEGDELFAED